MNSLAPTIRTYRWALTIAAAVLLVAVWVNSVSADPQQITITPTTATPYIKPGATYTGSVQVLDQGTTGYKYSLYTAPYHVSGEDYTPEFTLLQNAPKVVDWFHLLSAGGQINPGNVVTEKYSIVVPPHTQPGGYYAAIFAQATPPKSSSITLNERVGELFYIQVAGPVTQHGALLTWQTGTLQQPPLQSTLRIQDSGNLHFPATVHYEVDDVLGHPKYNLNTIKELLPQSIRRIPLSWDGAPPVGLFKVKGTVSYLGNTQTLPAKWVLVMSFGARIALVGIFAVILAFLLGRTTYKIKHKHHELKHPEHHKSDEEA